MLNLSCKRAELCDGQNILELGCGVGDHVLKEAKIVKKKGLILATDYSRLRHSGKVGLISLSILSIFLFIGNHPLIVFTTCFLIVNFCLEQKDLNSLILNHYHVYFSCDQAHA